MAINVLRNKTTQRWTCTVRDAESVRRARSGFAQYLQRLGTAEAAIHDATLVFGELAGNAVRHAGGEATVDVSRNGSRLTICVADGAPRAKLPIQPLNSDTEHGRGLRIVKQLSDDVWVRRSDNAKTVCAVLTLPSQPRTRRLGVPA